jgi:hypothetical protein
MNADDFLKGQRDCEKGAVHQSGKSESYDRGYAAQYQHEQNLSALGGRK